jgi:predicted TIM-barrel fold metal-dependent hydrolase
MRTITLEEHFTTQEFLKAIGQDNPTDERTQKINKKLLDVGEGRINDMDEAHIDMQVLSLSSNGLHNLDANVATKLAHKINNQLAEVISKYPKRFAGFATVALQDVDQSVIEFERCINELKFKGLMIMGTVNGIFLDDKRFEPIFKTAESLDVPIYIHPGMPPKPVADVYYTGFDKPINFLLSMAGYGWHAETGLHGLRIILSGLLDRFPKLKFIVGHMGDHLPFNIARANRVFDEAVHDKNKPLLKRNIIDYFRDNFYITTSGYFDIAPFNCALDVSGIDHILFSIDYPYAPNKSGYDFLKTLPVNDQDKEKIAHLNTSQLLKL